MLMRTVACKLLQVQERRIFKDRDLHFSVQHDVILVGSYLWPPQGLWIQGVPAPSSLNAPQPPLAALARVTLSE